MGRFHLVMSMSMAETLSPFVCQFVVNAFVDIQTATSNPSRRRCVSRRGAAHETCPWPLSYLSWIPWFPVCFLSSPSCSMIRTSKCQVAGEWELVAATVYDEWAELVFCLLQMRTASSVIPSSGKLTVQLDLAAVCRRQLRKCILRFFHFLRRKLEPFCGRYASTIGNTTTLLLTTCPLVRGGRRHALGKPWGMRSCLTAAVNYPYVLFTLPVIACWATWK